VLLRLLLRMLERLLLLLLLLLLIPVLVCWGMRTWLLLLLRAEGCMQDGLAPGCVAGRVDLQERHLLVCCCCCPVWVEVVQVVPEGHLVEGQHFADRLEHADSQLVNWVAGWLIERPAGQGTRMRWSRGCVCVGNEHMDEQQHCQKHDEAAVSNAAAMAACDPQ
jgi:hypothetical protein